VAGAATTVEPPNTASTSSASGGVTKKTKSLPLAAFPVFKATGMSAAVGMTSTVAAVGTTASVALTAAASAGHTSLCAAESTVARSSWRPSLLRFLVLDI